MTDKEEIYEYELIDISFEFDYELPEGTGGFVRDDISSTDDEKPKIEYDADGIPMGDSQEEKFIRKDMIHKFIQQWRADHNENPCVFNEDIHEYIRINHTFLVESVTYSCIRYQSTKAIMRMEEIMTKAKKVDYSKVKEDDCNQKSFEKMIVMKYSSQELGTAKLTVGIKNRTHDKVAYSITNHESGTPFIDESLRVKPHPKVKKRKKRSR